MSGLHFYVFLFYFFCTSALLESALRAAENQAGWEPEPCPLWIKALCQSIPYWGINLKKKKPFAIQYNALAGGLPADSVLMLI